MSLKASLPFAVCSLVVLLAIPARAQALPDSAPSMFRYSIKDEKDSMRGGGELRVDGKDQIGLEIGAVKTKVSKTGSNISLTAEAKTELTWQSSAGSPSKQATINPDGSSVIQSFAKSGKKVYQISDTQDGSGKIEIFLNDKVKYVITIGPAGELSLNSIAESASPAVPQPETKPTVVNKPVTNPVTATPAVAKPAVATPAPNIQITPNSPPPLPQ